MRCFSLILIVLAMFALCVPAPAQTASAERTGEEPIRQTVAAFWKALGDLDAAGLKVTLDWPNVMVQTQPDRPTGPATINTDAAALEAEVRRTLEGLKGGRKGDFFGTTVSTTDVQFLGATLAYAHHVCRLGGEAGERAQARRGTRDFEALAVLRATGDATAPWTIVLITVPQ
jgi:hypothetical protein